MGASLLKVPLFCGVKDKAEGTRPFWGGSIPALRPTHILRVAWEQKDSFRGPHCWSAQTVHHRYQQREFERFAPPGGSGCAWQTYGLPGERLDSGNRVSQGPQHGKFD